VAGPKKLVESAIARARADLEEALSELEKMPAFDADSVIFAAHALSSYMTAARAGVELILMRLADHPDAQLRLWVEGVQHATNLMTRYILQLKGAFASTETLFRLEKVDLPTLVLRACDFYQRMAVRKRIHVIANSTVNVPHVLTDRVAVAAVLDNLLSNAVKYSNRGKQVSVELRSEKDWVVCDVRDEGPGLSKTDQAKLFQKGTTLTPKPTGGESASGYGLAVAKELIDKLGGEIWCESILGKGSCFSFRLPAFQEPIEQTQDSDRQVSVQASGKVGSAAS
jgi:signal transduction histidine kinase